MGDDLYPFSCILNDDLYLSVAESMESGYVAIKKFKFDISAQLELGHNNY